VTKRRKRGFSRAERNFLALHSLVAEQLPNSCQFAILRGLRTIAYITPSSKTISTLQKRLREDGHG
jgi:hypothetical protein